MSNVQWSILLFGSWVGLVGWLSHFRRELLRRVGRLDLEERARRQHLVYVPVARELAAGMLEFSTPVQVRFIFDEDNELLGQFEVRKPLEPDEVAPSIGAGAFEI